MTAAIIVNLNNWQKASNGKWEICVLDNYFAISMAIKVKDEIVSIEEGFDIEYVGLENLDRYLLEVIGRMIINCNKEMAKRNPYN